MNKNEKIRAILDGHVFQTPAYAFWTHFPGIDLDPKLLAEHTYDFYNTYDIDFVKVMSNGMYAVEDFGCVCDYSEVPSGGVAKLIETPIKQYEDWTKIEPVAVQAKALERELSSLHLLGKKLQNAVPVVFTVFSPVTIAQKLSKNQLLTHIEKGKTALIHQALRAIAKTTADLSAKAIELGAAGVFFATQLSSFISMTEEQYREYGVPYDLQVLESAQEGWLNILHIHGRQIMFDLLKEYPVQAINWHVWETPPTLAEARVRSSKCFLGGIKRHDVTQGNIKALHQQIQRALQETEGKDHILTPGCVIRYPLQKEVLAYIQEIIQQLPSP
jgi:uroporphyrinogen decarboxylase